MEAKTETTDVNRYVGNDAISSHVNAARSLWQDEKKNSLSLGKEFSKLRAEVEKYQRNNKGLTYRQAVALTGVPWSTAERYRQMYEMTTEHKVPADAFLALYEEGANLVEIKASLKEGFQSSIEPLLPAITSLDVTDSHAVVDIANALKQLIPKSLANSDLETLNGELGTLLGELSTVKSAEERIEIAAAIHQKHTDISESQVRLMKGLVHGLAPFVEWSPDKVRGYIAEFSEQPLALQTKLFSQATTFAKDVVAGIAIAKQKAA